MQEGWEHRQMRWLYCSSEVLFDCLTGQLSNGRHGASFVRQTRLGVARDLDSRTHFEAGEE